MPIYNPISNSDLIAIKDLANKFTSTNVEGALSELVAPVTTYTHSGNTEIVISAVDVATNRFTSVGHPLINGNTIYPIINDNAGIVFPTNVYAGGLTQVVNGYYVKKIDADTFELYAESALTTILDVTENTNMDLTKWHFEKSGSNTSVTISGLTPAKKYRLVINGRCLQLNASAHVHVNDNPLAAEYIASGNTVYTNPNILCNGDIDNFVRVEIDYTKHLTIVAKGCKIHSNTVIAYGTIALDKYFISPEYVGQDITSITLKYCTPANGYKIEVWRCD